MSGKEMLFNRIKKGGLCRKTAVFAVLVLLVAIFGACDNIFNCEKFDRTLLSGHWVSGTVHEFYDPAGSGYTWDTADDVTEEEAQKFTWTLEKSTLTQIHLIEMGGTVPKTYTLTRLNATNLEYHDDYGKYYSFTKEEKNVSDKK